MFIVINFVQISSGLQEKKLFKDATKTACI